MRPWHTILWIIPILNLAGAASAQSVLLAEDSLVDSCCRIKLALDLKGKITFRAQGAMKTEQHNASAEHAYVERILSAKDGMAERSARIYETATATIGNHTRTLRPARSFMVAHRIKDELLTYCPDGPLFDQEMELTEHFDTLALPGLLPGKSVSVGESWTVPPVVVQAICGLDALDAAGKQELTGILKSTEAETALITLQGTIKGIQLGAPVSIYVDPKTQLLFDCKQKRIVQVNWVQSDERKQGPATPNLSADVTITLRRTPIELPPQLNNVALAQVPKDAPPERLTEIEYRDEKNKLAFRHSRQWQYVGERNGQRVLRLISPRGDWLADAIVMPRSGPTLDAKDFRQMIEQAPGWEQEAESQMEDKVKHPRDYNVVHVSAQGKLEGAAAFRSCYYLVSERGEQAIVTFIVPPGQINALENRDTTLVDSIELK